MEVKDVGLAAVMIVSTIILTDRWLSRFGDSDVEENLDKKMEAIAQSTSHSIGEFSKRIYR
jgi:hypothetical protein